MKYGVLPIKVFLKHRIHANNFSTLCGWCGKYGEDMPHLLKDCELAGWVWEGIASWWKIPLNLFSSATFSLRNIFSLVDDAVLNKPWKSIIAVGVWAIWITRNGKVFDQNDTKKDRVFDMVKL